MSDVGAEWSAIIQDREGRVVLEKNGANSILTAYMTFLLTVMALGSAMAGYQNLKDKTGTLISTAMTSYHDGNDTVTQPAYGTIIRPKLGGVDTAAAANNAGWGILVGTGTTAVTPADYNLATPIIGGTGAGQLNYGASTVDAPRIASDRSEQSFTRTFTNGSMGTVTVQEMGLFVQARNSASTGYVFMLLRDLTGALDVPPSGTLTLVYRTYTTL